MEEHYIKDVGKITYVYGVNLEEHKTVIEKQQKRIAELEKQLDQLKQQLAEKDKEIERLKFFEKAYYYNQLQASEDTIKNLFRSSYQSPVAINVNQLAIQELEKVEELILKIDNNHTEIKTLKNGYSTLYVDRPTVIYIIDQQIKKLKGEKDVED